MLCPNEAKTAVRLPAGRQVFLLPIAIGTWYKTNALDECRAEALTKAKRASWGTSFGGKTDYSSVTNLRSGLLSSVGANYCLEA
jgi:hypothetical protein